MSRYANILETVGNTPVVRINKLAPPHVNLYVKVEAFNPLGSVKDRLALGVIESFGAVYLSYDYRDAFGLGLLILFLLFRPQGLFGEKGREV